ncbi:MAG: hypothetical protein PVG32_01525 [Anaerolineales bacterium]
MASAAGPQLFQSCFSQAGAGRLARTGSGVGEGEGVGEKGTGVGEEGVGVCVSMDRGEAVSEGWGNASRVDWASEARLALAWGLGVGTAPAGWMTPRR